MVVPFRGVKEITPRDLSAQLKKDGAEVQLLDVRSEAEFAGGRILGAQNVPIHALPHALASLNLDPNRSVVAICLSGHRSVPAYRLLKCAGFRKVHSLGGGMMAWWRARLPTTEDEK